MIDVKDTQAYQEAMQSRDALTCDLIADEHRELVGIINRAVELLQADNKDLASWHIAKDELIKEIEG